MAVLAVVLCWLFPYTGDDWAWGSSIGIERLSTWFDNYSGRYLGNLIVLAMTRSRILRAVVMSLTLTGSVWCIEKITQRRWAFIVSVLSLLLLPRLVARQAVVWTAGFANYATSIFLTLVFFVWLNAHPVTKDRYRAPVSAALLLAVLGICNTLIVEHLTVFHVAASVCLVLYGLAFCRTLRTDLLAYAVGCICGALYMFSNSVYHSIATNEDGYRKIAGDGLVTRAVKNYFGVIYHEGYFNNHFINILIFAACVLLFIRFVRKKPDRLQLFAVVVCLLVMALFMAYSLYYFKNHGYDYKAYKITQRVLFEGCLTAANLVATILLSLLTTREKRINHRIALLWLAALMMIAPLFAVTPIGSRCFFSSYIVLVLIVCELYKCIPVSGAGEKLRKAALAAGCLLIIVCTVYHFYVFSAIYRADMQRLQHVREGVAAGQKSVELTHLPYEEKLWTATPFKEDDIWETRYKLFYGIPEDVDLVIVDYPEDSVN